MTIHRAVPNLLTANAGPLSALEKQIVTHQKKIEAWFVQQWAATEAPFYCSVDLRNSGYKLAPVDTNLFPAGFNNLSSTFLPLCIQAVQSAITKKCSTAKGILLIPESHTRNVFYLENVASLQAILIAAGYEVRIGSLIKELVDTKTIHLTSGKKLVLEPLTRSGDRVMVNTFSPCCIVSNNDFSEVPSILENIEQIIMPSLHLGWAMRLKSGHFHHYQNVSDEFGRLFDVDPWCIAPLFRYCGEIDFMTREGEDCLVKNATALLNAVKRKYQEYHIPHPPFVVIKADSGTYGMNVMMVKDPEQIRHLNRKQRTKMAASKGGRAVSKAIVQEGVYSFETWGKNKAVAEPVVYMIDTQVVGGFYRIHKNRGSDENLNTPGANFEPLAFAKPCHPYHEPDDCANRFYNYGVIARLALLAAAKEAAEVSDRKK